MLMKYLEELGPVLVYRRRLLIIQGQLALGTVVPSWRCCAGCTARVGPAGVHVDIVTSYALLRSHLRHAGSGAGDQGRDRRPGAGDGRRAVLSSVSFSHGATEDPARHRADGGAGECVAVVGPSGAGKSTLVGADPRLFEPRAGRSPSTGSTCGRCGCRRCGPTSASSAGDVLFHASIMDNLR